MLHLELLNLVEARAKDADAVCFLDAARDYHPTTFRQLREDALRLVLQLSEKGVRRGGLCAVDMGNCREYVMLLLAAAYGGFGLVALNAHLSPIEKRDRARELYQTAGANSLALLDRETVAELLETSYDTFESQEYVNKLAQAAQHGLASADDRATAVVMFTSGTQGKPKAANLSWGNLLGAASAANVRLASDASSGTPVLWQLALPLYHVGGLSIVMRAILGQASFVLYERFDAYTLLRDARHLEATHVSVVDKMLQDMLAQDKLAQNGDAPELARLSSYACILLGGAAPNPETLRRAVRAKARVEVGYGQTETSALAASALATKSFDGLLSPLPGYEFAIADAGEDGSGKLCVKGPGVFTGYLNAQTPFTGDGFFLTGDTGYLEGHRIRVAERTEDMFVSGGENIYPEEIRARMCKVPGVSDAFVFGVEDATWGRRPAALVEMAPDADLDARQMAESVRTSLQMRMDKIYVPDKIIALEEFPRTSLGKVDRKALLKSYDRRVQLQRLDLWRVRLPLTHPIRTAKAKLTQRESLIVQATCRSGRTGLGESVAFSTDWYLPETIDQDIAFIRHTLWPLLADEPFMHPSEVWPLIQQLPAAHTHPLACAAVEMAFWDIYGKGVSKSIAKLIGGRSQVSEPGALRPVEKGCVPCGPVLGICTPKEAVAQVSALVDEGYTRVKMKVSPGHDIKQVAAVREAHPLLTLALDANQSYKDSQVDKLRALAEFNVAFIEEPLRPLHKPSVGPTDLFDRLARLQDSLPMPICLDESWTNGEQLIQALAAHPELRNVSVKIGKFGGLQAALDFYTWARERGLSLWMGGMYDTGISKRLHAAFGMLPGIQHPGDISGTGRYLATEICSPPFEPVEGQLQVNPEGHEHGLGCDLDLDALETVAVGHWTCE